MAYITVPGSRFVKVATSESLLEYQNLTYAEFRLFARDGILDPLGGNHISVGSRSAFDGYDFFLKVELCEDRYRELLDDRVAEFAREHKRVRQEHSSNPYAPSKWPRVESPKWWQQVYSSPNVKADFYWAELLPNQESPNYRGIGSGWVFDVNEKVLYVWEWNRQHYKF